ncbi:hypothetical protein [Mesorhizobium sp. A623]
MRLIRFLAALVLLKAGFAALDAAVWLHHRVAEKPADGSRPDPYRPIERILLGSIVSLGICPLWIWISARAGQ